MKNMINKTGITDTKTFSDYTNCRKTFLLIIFILTCAKSDVIVEQQQVTASLRSSVTLKCIVTSENIPTLSWFFKDNRIFLDQKTIEDDKIVHKYTLSYTASLNSTRTYNLQIRNVLPTDDGMYTCQVIIAKNTIQRRIKLAIKYLNENPFVNCQFLSTSNTSIQLGSGHQTEKTRYQTQLITGISCRANIGKNIIVNITIMKSAQHELIPIYFATKEQSDALTGVNIIYPVDVTGLDGWQFWCVAHQSMMLQPLNSSTPLLIKPRVSITKLNTDSEQFKCEVESYPDATFRWIICEKEIANVTVEECNVLNSSSSNLTLMDVGVVDDVFILICEAQNAVGTGHGNLTITGPEPTDMTISRRSEPITTISQYAEPSKMRGGAHLVIWSITGGFVLLFSLALTIISLYFGKQSRYITRYLTEKTPVTIKKVKKNDANEKVKAGDACFDIVPDDANSRQIAAAAVASLCATPVTKEAGYTYNNEYHSESEYGLCVKSQYDIRGHTSILMTETQPLYHTIEDPKHNKKTIISKPVAGGVAGNILVT